MKNKSVILFLLLSVALHIYPAKVFWDYINKLGLEKVADLTESITRQLRQKPEYFKTKEISGYFNVNIDMFNISYYLSEPTIKDLTLIQKRVLGFNKTIYFPYFLSKRNIITATKSLSALIQKFNGQHIEKLIMKKDESGKFNITWHETTQSLLEARKIRINEIYSYLESIKTQFVTPKEKLPIIHEKWNVLTAIAKTKTTRATEDLKKNFETFVGKKLSYWKKVNVKTSGLLANSINLFSDSDKINFILNQDKIEKAITNLFLIDLDTKTITDQTLITLVKNYNDLLSEALHNVLISNTHKSADVENFLAHKKEKKLADLYVELTAYTKKFFLTEDIQVRTITISESSDFLAIKKQYDLYKRKFTTIMNNPFLVNYHYSTQIQEYISRIEHQFTLIKHAINQRNFNNTEETFQELNFLFTKIEDIENNIDPIVKKNIELIVKKYHTLSKLHSHLIQKIATIEDQDLKDNINKIKIESMLFYTKKELLESKKLLNEIEKQLKVIELKLKEESEKKENPIISEMKKLFGSPNLASQKNKVLVTLQKEIQDLHDTNNGFSSPSKSITARLNGIEKKLLQKLEQAKTENELADIETYFKERLASIEEELNKLFL